MTRKFVIAAALAFAGAAQADVVANWGFNDQGLPGGGYGFQVSDFPQNADVGAGQFSINNFNSDNTAGVYDWIKSFGGTTLGSIDGVSGGSFSLQGAADQAVTNNGAHAVFSFDGSSWTDLSFDFARRGTSTGFNSVAIELFDGSTSLGVIDTLGAAGSSWVLSSYDLSALNGVADASIVFTFDGATSNTGNNRLDNITISGNLAVVPLPPAAWAGLGMLGVMGGLRLRRK